MVSYFLMPSGPKHFFFILIGLLGKQWRWSRVNCLHPVSAKIFFYYAILVPIFIIIIFCYLPPFSIFQIFDFVLLVVTIPYSDRFYMVIWCLYVSHQIYIRCQIKEYINCWWCWWNKSCQNESVSIILLPVFLMYCLWVVIWCFEQAAFCFCRIIGDVL